jgi:hypothetical protein
MRPRTFIPLLGAGALLIATGIAVQVASAGERSELTAEYAEAGSWTGGLIGTFTIRNPTKDATQDWKLSFGMSDGAELAGVWNGTLSTSKGGTYTIKPVAQNKTVAGGAVMTIGFTALTSAHATPVNCAINGKACKITVKAAGSGELATGPQPAATQSQAGDQGVGTTGKTGNGGKATTGGQPAGPVAPSGPTPYVYLPAGDRPPLKTLAAASGSHALTLLSAVPPVGGGCDLKWGGVVDLDKYAKEITDALSGNIALIGAVGSGSGVDLAKVCGTAAAFEAQLKQLLALGVRSLDLTIPGNTVTDQVLNLRRAQVVKDLKAQYPDLSIAYTLPTAIGTEYTGGALDAVTAPLTAAKNAGAVIDRVNVLPVDLTGPAGPLSSLLSGLGLNNTVEPLLTIANGVHQKIMSIQGVDSAAAWKMLGIVPVIGSGDLLGGSTLPAPIAKLAEFAKANGLGMVGFLPLGIDHQCSGTGLLPISLPVLNCLDASVLPHFFTIANAFSHALG